MLIISGIKYRSESRENVPLLSIHNSAYEFHRTGPDNNVTKDITAPRHFSNQSYRQMHASMTKRMHTLSHTYTHNGKLAKLLLCYTDALWAFYGSIGRRGTPTYVPCTRCRIMRAAKRSKVIRGKFRRAKGSKGDLQVNLCLILRAWFRAYLNLQ